MSDTYAGFCEDNWFYIKINGNVFRHASMCSRCVFTAVNPDDGSRNPDGEPLKTLKSFRYFILIFLKKYWIKNVFHVCFLWYSRGKSPLESWFTTFLPDWQLPLIFVRFISNFLCMCSNGMASAHGILK